MIYLLNYELGNRVAGPPLDRRTNALRAIASIVLAGKSNG